MQRWWTITGPRWGHLPPAADGVILGSSGHLRVKVLPAQVTVEYVRAILTADETAAQTNGMVAYTYTLSTCTPAPAPQWQFDGTIVLGRPTDRSITANVLAPGDLQAFFEYGRQAGVYTMQTPVADLVAGQPCEAVMDRLQPNPQYYYRLRFKGTCETLFRADAEHAFHAQRSPGSTYRFCIQGDSHPERAGKQFNADLYVRTLQTATADQPDFYIAMGDDFSVDTLSTLTADTVRQRYEIQRPYLGLISFEAPLFLVNGNHEQVAAYLLDGTAENVAVWAQNARNAYYPQPAPDGFYAGDAESVEHIGLLRDYYALTWGDALFVVIDPYWHLPVSVDNALGDADKRSNMWLLTLGEAQYRWFKTSLEECPCRYKFVFAHHVNGTGRGGVELAGLYEWDGLDKNGVWEFDTRRSGWGKPIHRRMA